MLRNHSSAKPTTKYSLVFEQKPEKAESASPLSTFTSTNGWFDLAEELLDVLVQIDLGDTCPMLHASSDNLQVTIMDRARIFICEGEACFRYCECKLTRRDSQ